MAPPSNRRSGYSRRAQYSTFFSYLAGIAGALVGVALLIVSIADPKSFAGLRSAAAAAAEPAGQVAARGRAGSHGFLSEIAAYFAAGSKNAKLQRELEAAKVRLVEAQAIAEENRRLKALLGLARQEPRPVAITEITSSTASSTRRFATIAAGSRKGITVGMPVRSPIGLVGRVVEAGPSSSRVMLVSDTESVVPVRRATDGMPAFAQGKGDGTLQIRLINLGINPLKKGDVFVTSGSGGLYRPGVVIGTVASLTRDGAIVHVLSDPGATEFVTVEPIWSAPSSPAPSSLPQNPAYKQGTRP